MQIWVGLGNPGPEFALHRHNVGFMAIDIIADMHGFEPPKRRFQGWAQEGRLGHQKLLLLIPMMKSNLWFACGCYFLKVLTMSALTVLVFI
jgi:peptidyl-tRNA hydrolase